MKPLRIGTRGSQLALWQANHLAYLLTAAGFETEIVPIKTTGDKRRDVPLASIGGKGLFIKELEEALLAREVDLAVHSLKDVPSIIPDEFELAAFLERADPRDAWIQYQGKAIADLPPGSTVGTSSPRRAAQIVASWPHVRVEGIRGNVETRLARHGEGDYDGVVLASAGLTRLGWISQAHSLFTVDEMVPAAGQGIIGIEIVRGRDDVREAVRRVNHARTETAALAERGVLQTFGTRLDCYSPIAVHASGDGHALTVRAFLSDLRGRDAIRVRKEGSELTALIQDVAAELEAGGAAALLARGPEA